MISFQNYLMRHGEYGVQAIVECWERYEGIRANSDVSLEDRWMVFIGNTQELPYKQNLLAA